MTANRLPRLLMWNIRPIQIVGRITWMGMFAGANWALVAAPSEWLTGWGFYAFFAAWAAIAIATEGSIDMDHPVPRKIAENLHSWPEGQVTEAQVVCAVMAAAIVETIAFCVLPEHYAGVGFMSGPAVFFSLLSMFRVVAWARSI
jgi:hypothetical protein